MSDVCKKQWCGGSKDNIIDIEKEICNVRTFAKDKERSIRFGLKKPNGLGKRGKALKPCTWSLFKTIERFEKETNVWDIGDQRSQSVVGYK
jgi:hypothetical protein